MKNNFRDNNSMFNPIIKEKYLKSMKDKVWNSKERNEKISRKLKGNVNGRFRINTKHTQETIKKISNSKKGTKSHRGGLTAEQEYGLEKSKELREKYRQNAINTIKKLKISKISKAELKLKEYLENKDTRFIMQYKYPMGIADFYLPDYNLIIECDGIYWHSKPDYLKRDINKRKWLENNGYKVVVLNSEKILNGEQTMQDLLQWWRKEEDT